MMLNITTDLLSTTDTGLVREHNEDSFGTAETPNGTVCVVCDGMGGHAGGQEASQIAVNCIIQHLSCEKYADIRVAIRDALEFANMQILGAAAEHPDLQGMGTTACVAVFQEDKMWIAHIGDSRIYLFVAKANRLHRLTKDHSYVQGLVDQGIIYADEAENHPDKNRILKALGIKEELNPDISDNPILPAKGDIFLVCSDGLSGMVSDKEIEKILADKTALKEKEIALMTAAKAAGGTDNITFQLAKISQSPHRKSVFESKNPNEANVGTRRALTLRNAIIIATLAIICALVGLWIGTGKTSQSEKQEMPADTTKIINQQDTTINNPINQSLDNI